MADQATSPPEKIAPRRFEYADDRSYKFWTIALNGPVVTMRYGRIGSTGQTHRVRFDTIQEAKSGYEQRVRRKVRAGYEERLPTNKQVITSDDAWRQLQDHEPLIQAILEDPDDPARYAIYADWLLERNDPRGEFTQLQLTLEDPALPLYRRPKIENAATLLRQRHARQWLGNLVPWLMDYGSASHGYDFFRGQLASLHCQTLGVRFANALRKSPSCRLLRELSIESTEVVRESIELDGQRFEAGRNYGLEGLKGADLGNLREFWLGMVSAAWTTNQALFAPTTHVLDLVESMPRLETLVLRAEIDLERLLEMELAKLTSLHLTIRPDQIHLLEQSGILPRLQTLGFLTPITESMVPSMIRMTGFDQLTQFSCSETCALSDEAVAALQSTGVVINVPCFTP